jgi:hypothetical protein
MLQDISALGIQERILLFCAGSSTDWQRAGISGDMVTTLIVRGLLVRDAAGRLALTEDGRGALRALLPELSEGMHSASR